MVTPFTKRNPKSNSHFPLSRLSSKRQKYKLPLRHALSYKIVSTETGRQILDPLIRNYNLPKSNKRKSRWQFSKVQKHTICLLLVSPPRYTVQTKFYIYVTVFTMSLLAHLLYLCRVTPIFEKPFRNHNKYFSINLNILRKCSGRKEEHYKRSSIHIYTTAKI